MMARQQLVEAYDSWERWSQREGVAIREGNWYRVSECQRTKLELQGRIIRLTEAANTECAKAGLDPKAFEHNIRQIVNGLIALETRNAKLLCDSRKAATSQMAELDQASCNLRRVRKSYGQPSRAAWHSYS